MARRLFSRRLMMVALLLALALLFLSCTPSHPQSTFDAKGPVAENQLNLFWVIFWAALAVFIVVVGLLIYSMVRFRQRPGQGLPVQVHGNRRLEIAWTIVPALLLTAIAVMTVRTLFELRSPPSDDPLRVEVIAHQWWWEVIYPDYNITTANEIVVPVDRDVMITLDSYDVVHSFWVPKLRGKKDIIPNKTNTTWFSAAEAGVFRGQCAEFCGIAHALMQFQVEAKPQEEFQEWLDGQRTMAAIPTTGAAAEGLRVFNSKGCLVCHTTTGPDTMAIRESRQQAFLDGHALTHAPNLTHFASRSTLAGAIMENTEENLRAWLRDPEEVKPGNRMARLAEAFNNPDLALTEEDITALIAYLQTLTAPPPPPAGTPTSTSTQTIDGRSPGSEVLSARAAADATL